MSENSTQKLPGCPAVGSQTATICLPVTVKPYALTGKAKLECCGKPVIAPACKKCHGIPNGKCEYTISQTIRVDLPVEFGATVATGETFVDCYCDGDLQQIQSEELGDDFPFNTNCCCGDCSELSEDFGSTSDNDVSNENLI